MFKVLVVSPYMFKDLMATSCIFKDLMAFSFVDLMKRKLPRHLKNLIQGLVVITNLVFIFKLSGWVILGPLWLRIVWSMQKDAQHVNSM